MKILVTGATGFVGSHLCDALIEQGHEVFALVRTPAKAAILPSQVHIIKGDISYGSIKKWIEELPLDLNGIIHTAGIVHSFNHREFYEINTEGTAFLIDQFKLHYPTLHFTLISSLAAVGPSSLEKPHTEATELEPVSNYGKSKKFSELMLQEHAPKEWKTTIIRPPMVIGPRDTAVLDVFKMVNSRVVLSTGLKGMQKLYSFVCVFDLVDVITNSLEKQELQNDIFFSAYPQYVTFKEIINQIESSLSKKAFTLLVPFFIIKILANFFNILSIFFKISIPLTPDKLKELEPRAWHCSGQRSQEVLGVKYNWPLKKTIEVTCSDYRDRGWL